MRISRSCVISDVVLGSVLLCAVVLSGLKWVSTLLQVVLTVARL